MLTIGAFARASRLSVKALRLYEQHQLLTPHHVAAATGYRYYRAAQLEQARLIAALREIAMPLTTVADVLTAEDDAEADRRIAFWWAGQEHATHVRRELVHSLRAGIRSDAPGNTPFGLPTAYRHAPAQMLLTAQSATTVEQLPGFIAATITRLAPLSTTVPGTPDHPVIVIYHGRVNVDSDGPVEVCLTLPADQPINPEHLPPAVNLRLQPAQREAFTTLTKRQLVYPDVLAAYDQLETRIHADGRKPAGPPREYYFTDIHVARPDQPVCHAAIPSGDRTGSAGSPTSRGARRASTEEGRSTSFGSDESKG